MRGTRSAGYGFVTVKSLETAQKACEQLDKTDLEGRQVVIEVAKPSEQKDKERAERRAKRRAGRARGRAPPGEVTEAEANGEAEKPDAAIEASADTEGDKRKPRKKRAPHKKGKKTAEGASAEGTEGANAEGEAASATAAKRQRTPRTRRAPRPAGEEPLGDPSKTVLFVANLGFNIEDAGLAELFKDAGINVISARIVRRRWGKPRKSKGYGFVDVGGEEEQKKAIAALEGKEIEGRQLAVKVAVNAGHEDEENAASPEAVVLAQ